MHFVHATIAAMKDAHLTAIADRALQRLRSASPACAALLEGPQAAAKVRRVAVASDFAIDTLAAPAALLSNLIADDGASAVQPPLLEPRTVRSDWPALLRRYRAAESTRLVWRDVLGLDARRATPWPAARASPSTACSRRWKRWKASSRNAMAWSGAHATGGARSGWWCSGWASSVAANSISVPTSTSSTPTSSDGESDGARPLAAENYFARLGPAAGQAARRDHRRWLQPSRRPAPASVRQRRPRGLVVRGDGAVLPARRPRLGALRLAEGAAGGGRHRRRRALPRDAAAVRVSPLPRLRRARWPARDEGGDQRRGRAQGTRRRHQARPRRHPRDRIPGAGPAADPRRPRAGAARASLAAGAAGAGRGATTQRTRPATRWPRPIASCAGSKTACRCCATRRRMRCPSSDVDRAAHRRGARLCRTGRRCATRSMRSARVSPREFDALLAPRRRAAGARCAGAYWHALPEAGEAGVLADAGFVEAEHADGLLRDFARSPGVRDLSDPRARAWTACCRRCSQRPRRSSRPDARAAPAAGAAAERPAPQRATWPCSTSSRRAGASGRRGRAQRAAGRTPGGASAAAGRTAGCARGRSAAGPRRAARGMRAGRGDDDDAEAALQALNEVRQA